MRTFTPLLGAQIILEPRAAITLAVDTGYDGDPLPAPQPPPVPLKPRGRVR